MQVLATRYHPASLKDLVCASVQTKPECTENLPQELVSYLEEYKKRRFVTIFFVADEEGTGIAFIRRGRQGGVCYEVTNLERLVIIFTIRGSKIDHRGGPSNDSQIKVDLPLCKLTKTLSLAFYDNYIFVKHGKTFSAMHTLEGEKHLVI